MEYWLVLVNIGYGPDEMSPLAWILIMDHLLVMDHMEYIIVMDTDHGPYEMPPLAWKLIMDHILVMDHMECIVGKYVHHSHGY